MAEYILASGSPRRKEILAQVGISFKVIKSDCEEVSSHSEPENIVGELSRLKCLDVANAISAGKTDVFRDAPGEDTKEDVIYVIGADTIVSVDGTIMGKPRDTDHAYEMIKKIQGREHTVHTGVSIARLVREEKGGVTVDAVKTFVEGSTVSVVPMTDDEINDYISGEEPYDKAGGYAIQGLFAKYIKGISGDFYNIVGFPVCRFLMEIKNFS